MVRNIVRLILSLILSDALSANDSFHHKFWNMNHFQKPDVTLSETESDRMEYPYHRAVEIQRVLIACIPYAMQGRNSGSARLLHVIQEIFYYGMTERVRLIGKRYFQMLLPVSAGNRDKSVFQYGSRKSSSPNLPKQAKMK